MLSEQAIRRTTRSMATALFTRRDLVVEDTPVVEVSDSSESRPHQAPIGPTILDLKYVSASEHEDISVQRSNPMLNAEQEINQELRTGPGNTKGTNMEHIQQPIQTPSVQVISSLEIELKEAQVVNAFAMEEIQSLKADLATWIDKWNSLKEKKTQYRAYGKSLLIKNK